MEKMQVLIIDDDRDTAIFYSVVMELLGQSTELVYSARNAIIRLAGSAPDIILLDMLLGSEIGGEEILYQIRSNPRYDATKVVIVTAYPSTTEGISNLADLILIKPVEVEQLKDLVTHLSGIDDAGRAKPFRDPVTQFYIKEFFYTRVELALERRRRRPEFLFAVTAFELYLQDWDSAAVGPVALTSIMREFSERIRHQMRPTDTIARFANWRFYMLHEEIRKPEDVPIITNRTNLVLAEPFKVGPEKFQLMAHFGSVVSSDDFTRVRDIIAAAEKALQARVQIATAVLDPRKFLKDPKDPGTE